MPLLQTPWSQMRPHSFTPASPPPYPSYLLLLWCHDRRRDFLSHHENFSYSLTAENQMKSHLLVNVQKWDIRMVLLYSWTKNTVYFNQAA